MDDVNKLLEEFEDPDYFVNIKNNIEKELANIKKIVNDIIQLRGLFLIQSFVWKRTNTD